MRKRKNIFWLANQWFGYFIKSALANMSWSSCFCWWVSFSHFSFLHIPARFILDFTARIQPFLWQWDELSYKGNSYIRKSLISRDRWSFSSMLWGSSFITVDLAHFSSRLCLWLELFWVCIKQPDSSSAGWNQWQPFSSHWSWWQPHMNEEI